MKSRFITMFVCLIAILPVYSFTYAASNAVNIGSDGITFPDNSVQNKAVVLPSCSSGDVLVNSSGAWFCGKAVLVNGGLAMCVGNVCTINSCTPGFADCDGNPTNGCEIYLLYNINNCGTCGTTCKVNESCDTGKCHLRLTALGIQFLSTDAVGTLHTSTIIGGVPPYRFVSMVLADINADIVGTTLNVTNNFTGVTPATTQVLIGDTSNNQAYVTIQYFK